LGGSATAVNADGVSGVGHLFGGGVPPPGWVAWLPPSPASLAVLLPLRECI
jgi:hypothetical protein